MSSSATAVYPGSFDIITNGHLDLIQRGATLFSHLIVAIAVNERKTPLFSAEERVEQLREVTRHMANVEIDAFEGLTIDYLRQKQATVIIRGLRFVSDFEFELQMAFMNRSMAPEIETIFMAPASEFSFLSSSLVRELASQGRDVSPYVPPSMALSLRSRLGN